MVLAQMEMQNNEQNQRPKLSTHNFSHEIWTKMKKYLQQIVLRKLDIHEQKKMKLDPYLSPCTKPNSSFHRLKREVSLKKKVCKSQR